jgi:hypothetical protein
MKNIHPSILPHFHGLVSEDIDAFLFKIYIMCDNYDYASNAQKMRLFPTILKYASLHWFMGLGGTPLEHGIKCVEHSSRNIKITIRIGNQENKYLK